MAIKYQHSKFAFQCTGEKLTEQEHKDSCDINRMIRNAIRGNPVRTQKIPPWRDGLTDDMNRSGLSHRIEKQKLESQLSELAKTDLHPEALKEIPESLQKKFGFKSKKPKPAKNDDDQTTTKKADPKAQNEIPSSNPSTMSSPKAPTTT